MVKRYSLSIATLKRFLQGVADLLKLNFQDTILLHIK